MRGRLIVGIILVLIGLGAMLDLAGTWDFSGFLATWWPLALIGVGLLQVARGHWFGPAILVILGLFFLARNLGYFEREWGRFVWPALLVIIGISLVTAALRGRPGKQERSKDAAASTGTIDRFTMFGGIEERVTGHFEGGSVLALFGGAQIDLRDADLADHPVIDATAAFGGVGILVPEGTRVHVEGTPIFGGIESKVEGRPDGPELTVKGVALFGGIEIKDRKD